MRHVFSVLLASAAVLSAGAASAIALSPASPAIEQAVAPSERGQTVYADQKCSLCHSVAGKGNPKGSLDRIGTKLKADEMRQWLVNAPEMAAKAGATRKPAMKALSGLSKDDLDALVGYLQSLKK